jgi:stage V sporulation protein B
MRLFSSLVTSLIVIILPLRLMSLGMSAGEATADYGRIAGMANPLLLAPFAIISSLTIVLIPEISEKSVKGEYGSLNASITGGIKLSLVIAGVFMMLFFALGEELTKLLFSDARSGQYLSFACWLMLPMAVNQLTASALNSIAKEARGFANYMFGTVFMLAAIYFLPPYIGIYSVAVASFLSITITTALNCAALNKITGMPFSFMKSFVFVVAAVFPCAYLAKNLNDLIARYVPVVGLFAAIIASALMYAALAIMFDFVSIDGFLKRKKAISPTCTSL